MQNLDVISVNLWQLLVSLVNLVLLFLIVKKFLYKPVKNMLETRQSNIEGQYAAADEAKKQALANRDAYEQKLAEAKNEADSIIQSAVSIAKAREKEIVASARTDAESIVRQAEEHAALEIRKAEGVIREEIVDVSTRLTEKLLEREINSEDHTKLIDSFIDEIGDE
jgi:F-type H+-transporting ATPase subunit b